ASNSLSRDSWLVCREDSILGTCQNFGRPVAELVQFLYSLCTVAWSTQPVAYSLFGDAYGSQCLLDFVA
ncbi:MAG: hypothetical protein ACK528_11280, partial [Alphaproteobacteria bacterium]